MPSVLYILLAILSLIWGGSFYFVKVLLENFDPWTISFLRCFFGLMTIIIIMLLKGESFDLKGFPWKIASVIALFNTAIPWAFIAYSETMITSSMAAVLNATTPIWTLILGILFFRLKSTVFQFIGILIGFIGIIILVDLDWQGLQIQELSGIGTMIVVTLCYAWGTQMSKRHLQAPSVYQISFVTLLVGTLGSGSMALTTETIAWSAILDTSMLWALIGLGSLGSGVAYIIFYNLIQKGSAEFATLVTYLAPPFAIVWGYLFLQESITFSLIVGLVVILIGVFIAGRKKKVLPQSPTKRKQMVYR